MLDRNQPLKAVWDKPTASAAFTCLLKSPKVIYTLDKAVYNALASHRSIHVIILVFNICNSFHNNHEVGRWKSH